MRIHAAMYLDHQAAIQYPVEYVMKSIKFADVLHLFASDTENLQALMSAGNRAWGATLRRHIHPELGFHIQTPGDIPRMMNHAVKEATDYDFLVLVQADTLATPESCKAVEWFAQKPNLARALHLDTQIGMLHHYSGGGYGHTIVGRDWRGHFEGDGIGKSEDGADLPRLHLENRHDFGHLGLVCLEIGSLGVDYYYRHIRQASKTWNEAWLMGERLAAYERGQRNEFIRLSLHDLRSRIHCTMPLIDVRHFDGRFAQVIEDLGLTEDHEHVLAIGRQVEKEYARAPR